MKSQTCFRVKCVQSLEHELWYACSASLGKVWKSGTQLDEKVKENYSFWKLIIHPIYWHFHQDFMYHHLRTTSISHYKDLSDCPTSPVFGGQLVFQLLIGVRLFVTPWTAARQAPLSSTVSWSLLKIMSIESVMLSNHLILCCPLLFYIYIYTHTHNHIFLNQSSVDGHL